MDKTNRKEFIEYADKETQIRVFKEFMEETGYTADDMHQETMIPQSIIENLISGKSMMNISMAVDFEQYLGIPLCEWGIL